MRIGNQVLWPVLLALLSLPAAGQDAKRFFAQGLDRQTRGDLPGAIANYTWAIDLDPKNALAYNNRGEAKRHLGDVDGAIADFTRAIDLDPKHAKSYYNRGIAWKQRDDLAGAIADYTKALELDPKFAQAYNNRGFARQQQGDLAGAIADYSQALKIDPGNAIACNNRGIVFYSTGRWAEALADFRHKCELSPTEADDPELYSWVLRVRLGDKTTADRELAGYLLSRAGSVDDGRWAKTLGAFLLNHLGEEALLKAAASADRDKERAQRCSAWYFTGMKLLLSAERSAAVEHFQKCLATEKRKDPEYVFAAAELKTLD